MSEVSSQSRIGAAWRAALCVLVSLAVLALGPPGARAAGAPPRSTWLGSAPAGQQLQLVFPLGANVAGLERFAAAATTVGSPQYGDYEPIAWLARRFGASARVRARVTRFLKGQGAGAVKIDATGLFADATVKVRLAQRLFGTALGRFESAREGRYVAPTSPARVPAALRGAVTGVVGLDTRPVFGAPQAVVDRSASFPHTAAFGSDNVESGYLQRSGVASGCSGAVAQRGFTPNQYLSAYGYNTLQSTGVTGQDERVALIEIDGFRYSDLRSFADCFGLPVPQINGYGVGIKHPLAPGGETTLDTEVLTAAAPGLKGIDVYESQPRASDVLLSLTAPLQNAGNVPDVISASLGTCEEALLVSIGKSGIRAAEGALAAAAASGISILASSGDAGSSACVGKDGPVDSLAVSYPASSPFVTGVGGTNVALDQSNQITRQTVWNDAPATLDAGGGGVSGLFPRPSYQNGFQSRSGRGVPDVSMLADVAPGYDIFCTAPGECLNAHNSNPWVPVGGTSAASPLLAGGLALIDQLLRQHGKQNLGLANSFLYTLDRGSAGGQVFSDISSNDNDLGQYIPQGDHLPLGCCSAKPGYDFASGLGSVNVSALALLAVSSQPPVASVGVSLPGQRPLAHHRVLAAVSCSRSCLAGAIGSVSVPGAASIKLHSAAHLLSGGGHRTMRLALTNAQVKQLRRRLRSHAQIVATIYAVVLDPSGNVEATSSPRTLRITG